MFKRTPKNQLLVGLSMYCKRLPARHEVVTVQVFYERYIKDFPPVMDNKYGPKQDQGVQGEEFIKEKHFSKTILDPRKICIKISSFASLTTRISPPMARKLRKQNLSCTPYSCLRMSACLLSARQGI